MDLPREPSHSAPGSLLREHPSSLGSQPSASRAQTLDDAGWAAKRREISHGHHIPEGNSVGSSHTVALLQTLSLKNWSFLSPKGPATPAVDTYYCQICLENCPDSDGFSLSECGHRFCRDCLSSYLEVKIREAAVSELLCPFLPDSDVPVAGGDDGCQAQIGDADVRSIVTQELQDRLDRFREIKADPAARECPQCSTLVLGGSARRPRLVCSCCTAEFCFLHAGAHPGQTCRQYEQSRRVDERLARAYVSATSRPCPGCRKPIEKNGGCNHMTCPDCRTDFCWLCGFNIKNRVTEHYQEWRQCCYIKCLDRSVTFPNVCGCPGMQVRESRSINRSRRCASWYACCWRLGHCSQQLLLPIPLYFLTALMVLLFLIYFVLAVCSMLLYFPIACMYGLIRSRVCGMWVDWRSLLRERPSKIMCCGFCSSDS